MLKDRLMTMSTEQPTTKTPIAARNRADFDAKVKATLKVEYPVQGATVDVVKFSQDYKVRVQNVKKVIDDMKAEYDLNYPLPITAVKAQ